MMFAVVVLSEVLDDRGGILNRQPPLPEQAE